MLKIFKSELAKPDNFVVTLELVPGRESFGPGTDTLVGIARDAFADGRIAACSLTDNPGGNPALSPDVLGYEIFRHGLDVIVHFNCRDMNRAALESRALQLAHMGMKNILALTGDYSGKGFGGKGTPVFDIDSVLLIRMLRGLGEKIIASGDPEPFFTGCAVSPFKSREAEWIAQYKKLEMKIDNGASFVITQLGFDVQKFNELIRYHKQKQPHIPIMASVYLLSPRSARAMHHGRVPGAYVSEALYKKVVSEWQEDPRIGLKMAVDRAAKLAVILKGMGYRGIHIGGIHRSFKTVAAILDRMEQLQGHWPDYPGKLTAKKENNTLDYNPDIVNRYELQKKAGLKEKLFDYIPYRIFSLAHNLFFNKSAMLAPVYKKLASILEKHRKTWLLKRCLEDPLKVVLLSCQSCGDCGIQHVAFLCPESGCPKHTRNGPCGGSTDGCCEVHPEKLCIWVRAYDRLEHAKRLSDFLQGTVPPRMWELNKTSAWVNFHLDRDHQR
jgi:methylenetetrahydrofolate reductase (NADPH)